MLADVQTATDRNPYTHAVPTGHVLLLIRHIGTRNATVRSLQENDWAVHVVSSLVDVLKPPADNEMPSAAILDWSLLNGLLLEARRAELVELSEKIPLVLLVPQNWLRFLSAQQTGSAALLPKPFEADELFQAIEAAQARRRAQRLMMDAPLSAGTALELQG